MTNQEFKSVLKTIKLNESTISMVLGALIVAVVSFLVVRYFNNQNVTIGDIGPEGSKTTLEQELESGQHTVLKGETLWSIAEKDLGSGYKWTEIAQANELTNPNEIAEGQKLIIPQGEEKADGKKSPEDKGNYTVVAGDTLWDIAEKSYEDPYRWVDIAKTNNLKNPHLIHPGNQFILPS